MELDGAEWPLFGWSNDIRPALEDARSRDATAVLATLVGVQGSSPRPTGTQMVFDGQGATGYLSGGCLEADIANHAREVAQDGKPKWLTYGAGSPWIDIRPLCGGSLRILLERLPATDEAVGRLLSLTAQRRPARWVSDGEHRFVHAELTPSPLHFCHNSYGLSYAPRSRLIIVGGDPIALAIANLAGMSGFETIVVRPNGPTSLPPIKASYVRAPAGKAIRELKPDAWTTVIAATHDDALDDETVIAASSWGTGYIGVLGSRRRCLPRQERLLRQGMTIGQIEGIHAPIGVVECGKDPWAVAVSVIADVMHTQHVAAREALAPRSSPRIARYG